MTTCVSFLVLRIIFTDWLISILKKEAENSSETSVHIYETRPKFRVFKISMRARLQRIVTFSSEP
jgi:hypothetical protein